MAELSDDRIFELGQGTYFNVVTLPTGKKACLAKFIFTIAILSDMTEDSFGKRYCYRNQYEALDALEDWDGTGKPSGVFVDKSS